MIKPVLRQPRTLFLVMQLALGGTLLAANAPTFAAEAQNPPQTPDILLGPLFSDVQSAKLFPDQKKPLPTQCPRATH